MKKPVAIIGRIPPGCRRWLGYCVFVVALLLTPGAFSQTNAIALSPLQTSPLTDGGASVLRVFGALLLVTAIFLGGVWLYRNWQRLASRRHGAPRLNVVEVKSLGQRQAIYVVGYDQQRMLLASSPAGVTFLSHLPAAEEESAPEPVPAVRPTFAEAFQQVLSRKS